MMRRVYSGVGGKLGPLFWASKTPPKILAPAGVANNVSSLSAMDKDTQADIAMLSPTMADVAATVCESGGGTLKVVLVHYYTTHALLTHYSYSCTP
jgi:hypothetical protein